MPSPAVLFASLLFGLIGSVAFGFGKRNASWRPLIIGLALIVFPYFIDAVWLLYAVGGVLCVCLFVFRE
jgi:hypothetical protein